MHMSDTSIRVEAFSTANSIFAVPSSLRDAPPNFESVIFVVTLADERADRGSATAAMLGVPSCQ